MNNPTIAVHEQSSHRRLRTTAAAAYCALSKSSFDKARVTGLGPVFHKIGKAVVYDSRDLDAWLTEHRRKSTSDPGARADRKGAHICGDRRTSGAS